MNGPTPPQDESLKSGAVLVVALALVHLVMAGPAAFWLNVWSDEASTLFTTGNGFLAALTRAFDDEKQAPLYFWLMSVWRMIDKSVFFARIPSIIFNLISICLFFDIARRVLFWRGARLATAFFALHPFLVWTSVEIRVYALVILLALALVNLFIRGFIEDSKNARRWFLLCAVIALYTNYYLGFLLVGNFAALVFIRRRAAMTYLFCMVGVGLAIVPLLIMLRAQFADVANHVPTPRVWSEGISLVLSSITSFLMPTELFPAEDPTRLAVIRMWLFRGFLALLAVAVIWRRPDINRPWFMFGISAAVISLFLLVAYFLLGDIYVEIRHAAVLFPVLILAFATVIDDLTKDWSSAVGRPLTFLLVGIFSLLFAYSNLATFPDGVKRGDWVRVSEFIAEREVPGQPIVVFPVFDALNLPVHYRGQNTVVPSEKYFSFALEGRFGDESSQVSEINYLVSEIPTDAGEVWLLTTEVCQVSKACAPLEKFVAANYTTIEDKDFYKVRVRLLRKARQ